jgi:uncharacterized secreted protein with C-terminal beta-propeller domain
MQAFCSAPKIARIYEGFVRAPMFSLNDTLYILERQNAGWAINRLNFHTGKIEKRIPLPNYPGMTKITIFKNAIYFLYDQKNFPYYVRLYRYQL